MLEIYECDDCGKYFHESDTTRICLEDEYGVSGLFPTRSYENVGCCPYCGSTDYGELEDSEAISEALNEWWRWKKEKNQKKTLTNALIQQAMEKE